MHTPLAPQSPQAVEEPHQPRPEPEPKPEPEPASKLHWYRLFTGRAQLRDEDGKVIRTVTPNQSEYPHESEFVNWN